MLVFKNWSYLISGLLVSSASVGRSSVAVGLGSGVGLGVRANLNGVSFDNTVNLLPTGGLGVVTDVGGVHAVLGVVAITLLSHAHIDVVVVVLNAPLGVVVRGSLFEIRNILFYSERLD
jgi:hypothetical protein